MRMITIFFCSFLITGCAGLETVQQLDPEVYYKPDVQIKYEKQRFNGWGVLPARDDQTYKLEIKAPGTIDLLKISSCGRFATDEPGGKIFRNDKKYKYTYRPDPKMELSESCPLVVEAYEAGKGGRHSFGVFEVDGGKYKVESMVSKVSCNGSEKSYSGVSMCVTLESVKQLVIFTEPMQMASADEGCEIPVPADGMNWLFKTKNRECLYVFRAIGGGRGFARHLSIGFEDIAVRRYK